MNAPVYGAAKLRLSALDHRRAQATQRKLPLLHFVVLAILSVVEGVFVGWFCWFLQGGTVVFWLISSSCYWRELQEQG